MRFAIKRGLSSTLAVIIAGWLALGVVTTPLWAELKPSPEATSTGIPLAAPVELSPDTAIYRPTRKLPDPVLDKPVKKSKSAKNNQPKTPPAEAKATPAAQPSIQVKTIPAESAKETPAAVRIQPDASADKTPAVKQKTITDAVPSTAAPQTKAASTDIALAQTLTQSFRDDFMAVLQLAQTHLVNTCPKKKDRKNAAAVLDLDETLLDNRAYFAVHKSYDAKSWDEWVQFEEAPAIPEARSFVYWLLNNNFNVFFVSGRKESQREQTIKNLEKVGIPPAAYKGLFLKPDNYDKTSAGDFKTNVRKEIQTQGFNIVLVLGDQKSDITGADGIGFKLPNPVYNIP